MDRAKSEDAIGAKGRPFTGAEYLESLRDGRWGGLTKTECGIHTGPLPAPER